MDNTQNIDKLAQSFFIVLVFCSVASDSYIFINNILKNNYVKKKINYAKKMYKIARGLTLQNYINDDEGNIIIDDKDEDKNVKEQDEKENIDDNLELEIESKKTDESNIVNKEVLDETIINNISNSELYSENDINPIKEILEDNEHTNQIEEEYFENTDSIPDSVNELDKNNIEDCADEKNNRDNEIKKSKKNSKKNIKEVIIKHSNKKIKNKKINQCLI